MTWRNATIVLFVIAMYLLWRDCHRPAPEPDKQGQVDCAPDTRVATSWESSDRARASDDTPPTDAPKLGDSGYSINGIKLPGWVGFFAPHAGEDLRAYRDRMMPLAMTVVAPQRMRVGRSRDDFAKLAHLDQRQMAELDSAAKHAADELEEKAMAAVLNGDFNPSTFKPMTAISTARDMLDIVDKANQRFVQTLSESQRAQLAQHPFDFADYLVFSTKWEDLLDTL